jgi:predicted TIM-barrel fold metal-dependent hydrolase
LGEELSVVVIDADTHVDENEETWRYLTEAEVAFKPLQVLDPNKPMGYWLLDGVQRFRPVRDDNVTRTTLDTRELYDVQARLQDMDKMGVGIQVVYPTFFLSEITSRGEIHAALRKSYNRWLAERCAQSNGRLRWVALLPMHDPKAAIEELKFAKDNGACGFLKKGNEEMGFWPGESHFYPLYAEAEKLGLPACFHTGSGTSAPLHQFSGAANFYRSGLPVIHAFQSLLTLGVPAKFPGLRWGFIEANSSWIPGVMYNLSHSLSMLKDRPGTSRLSVGAFDVDFSEDLMKKNNFYVTCQTDEDLNYIMRYTGEDNLLIGSDYTHNDFSQENDMVENLKSRADSGDISHALVKKITEDNPKAFYGL